MTLIRQIYTDFLIFICENPPYLRNLRSIEMGVYARCQYSCAVHSKRFIAVIGATEALKRLLQTACYVALY